MYSGNYRRIEFGHTPAKSTQLNEFQSSQRQKYETNPKIQQSNILPKENVTLVQKELYEMFIPVRVKQQTDDCHATLTLKMLLQQQTHGQILRIELTDDNNYQFLQVLDLNEQEFLTLKNEQSLHVDFSTFPMKLADILQLCINSNEKTNNLNFFVSLENKNGESILNVIENNEFKKLTHLSLKFRSATDEMLKNFLSSRLTQCTAINEELQRRNKTLSDQLQDKIWECDGMRGELKKLQEDKDQQLQQLLNEEQKKFNEFKEQALSKESTLVRENENEKKLIVERNEKIINELSQKNNTLYDQVLTFQSTDRELKQRCNNLQNELNVTVKEVSELRITNKELDQLKFTQERQLIELRIQKEGLEKQMNDKENYLQNKQQLVENEKKQNKLLEEQVIEQKKQIEKLENRIQVLVDEVNKGNMIIEKLQQDLQKQKDKIKSKNGIVMEQDKIVQQLQETQDKLNKQINELKRDKDNYELRVRELESQNQDLKNKVIESQKLIESNNQMIQYLNKCINESKATAPQPSFKSQTFTTMRTPLQDDVNKYANLQKSFQNQSIPQQNISQLSNATISNRFNF